MKIGQATDLGYPTNLVRQKLKECNILILESNHNIKMLLEGSYPWPLKQRIMSKNGHLSNDDSIKLLKQVLHPDLEYLYLAHLSEENNRPEIVHDLFLDTLKSLNYGYIKMEIATQQQATNIALIG
ncbi:MAG: hypothetical protein A2161_18585 [Candidatus Schekmanbacteria bacterium RBG_13_48_7]|uniref:Metallo-beta-lactamase domain-containing protein n=1 Tax=Candidatus Schekmanbacteria bacterium RBG_13_48_7 TaxID=1817878 RepID=A0A1F7S3N7_9BACT|nr:MAG: hypothetical protein A2161_18585 [Candidatus Schekmanbacteria bacterium RBG_13_48_7]